MPSGWGFPGFAFPGLPASGFASAVGFAGSERTVRAVRLARFATGNWAAAGSGTSHASVTTPACRAAADTQISARPGYAFAFVASSVGTSLHSPSALNCSTLQVPNSAPGSSSSRFCHAGLAAATAGSAATCLRIVSSTWDDLTSG